MCVRVCVRVEGRWDGGELMKCVYRVGFWGARPTIMPFLETEIIEDTAATAEASTDYNSEVGCMYTVAAWPTPPIPRAGSAASALRRHHSPQQNGSGLGNRAATGRRGQDSHIYHTHT